MLMMSDYEEDLDDFSAENRDRAAESLVGAYRAESKDQWTAASGFTKKISRFFDRPTSWFKYEELIDDWLDQHERTDLSEMQTCTKDFLTENL